MVSQDTLLAALGKLVDCLPKPAFEKTRARAFESVLRSLVLKGVSDDDCPAPASGQ